MTYENITAGREDQMYINIEGLKEEYKHAFINSKSKKTSSTRTQMMI